MLAGIGHDGPPPFLAFTRVGCTGSLVSCVRGNWAVYLGRLLVRQPPGAAAIGLRISRDRSAQPDTTTGGARRTAARRRLAATAASTTVRAATSSAVAWPFTISKSAAPASLERSAGPAWLAPECPDWDWASPAGGMSAGCRVIDGRFRCRTGGAPAPRTRPAATPEPHGRAAVRARVPSPPPRAVPCR
jgi:hypothetical protein